MDGVSLHIVTQGLGEYRADENEHGYSLIHITKVNQMQIVDGKTRWDKPPLIVTATHVVADAIDQNDISDAIEQHYIAGCPYNLRRLVRKGKGKAHYAYLSLDPSDVTKTVLKASWASVPYTYCMVDSSAMTMVTSIPDQSEICRRC